MAWSIEFSREEVVCVFWLEFDVIEPSCKRFMFDSKDSFDGSNYCSRSKLIDWEELEIEVSELEGPSLGTLRELLFRLPDLCRFLSFFLSFECRWLESLNGNESAKGLSSSGKIDCIRRLSWQLVEFSSDRSVIVLSYYIRLNDSVLSRSSLALIFYRCCSFSRMMAMYSSSDAYCTQMLFS